MLNASDLDAYFHRIGFAGEARADLATLTAIHRLHVAAIPFENLDPLTGRPVRLDTEALVAKLVRSRRGGYCFEQNALLRAALETIGFPLTPLGARVVWMSPPEAPLGPRAHMLLLVHLAEGTFLADVGFGASVLDAPLRFELDLEQATPAAVYRLQREGERIALSARQGAGWRRAYVFTEEPMEQSDYQLGNYYCSTHPEVLFTHTLLVERVADGIRHSLMNNRLTQRGPGGELSERTLGNAQELGEVLEKVFNLEPPVPPELVWARILASPLALRAVG